MYRLANIVRDIKSRREMGLSYSQNGNGAFKISTGTPTGKSPLGRPRHKWEDNIRMYLKEMGINTRNRVIQPTLRIK